jgi:hypothetical protein
VHGLLRFGTRLPTTSLRSGLERDEADFFATAAVRSRGRLWAAGEAGTSINGRAEPGAGQTDVLVFMLGAGYRPAALPVEADLWLAGQNDLHPGAVRGNEDLTELRARIRTRGPVWGALQWIHGFGEYGPRNGIELTLGTAIDLELEK